MKISTSGGYSFSGSLENNTSSESWGIRKWENQSFWLTN